MPKGPRGEKRKADVIGNAILIAKIATGEVKDGVEDDGKDKNAQALGTQGRQGAGGVDDARAPGGDR